MTAALLRNAWLFDGQHLHRDQALWIEDGRIAALGPDPGQGGVDLGGDLLAPAYVDLQVNGGGGVMLNDAPTPATLARMAAAHRGLGTGWLLPTLITDRPAQVRAAIDAVAQGGIPEVAGLHLEGPHLARARKGAHDPALIRPMEEPDLALLIAAARDLPVLMVTLAPEAVRPDQVRALAAAGAIVALGHSDAGYEACRDLIRAGARVVTHLFNAMSQLGARAPGLVGAALDLGAVSAGIIADGVHVHPAALRIALRAKAGPGQLFLVSDAMAVAGTDAPGFDLGGRAVRRAEGRLELADGTLAGADLALTAAVDLVARETGDLARALGMATAIPAALAGLAPGAGRIVPGGPARLIRLRQGAGGLRLIDPRAERLAAPPGPGAP